MASLNASLRDAVKRFLFELGAGWYARKLGSGPEMELRRAFAEWLAPPPAARVLDVGCGPGHLARVLAARGCRVTGVDRGRLLLRIARRLAAREGLAVDFRRAPAERLPFPDAAFDFTIATTVIYFVRDPQAVLREMARVTRPGGTVATLDPTESMSRTHVAEYARRQGLNARDTHKLVVWARAAETFNRRFTEAEMRALLASAGLGEIHLERRLDGMVWFSRSTRHSGLPGAS